MVKKLIGSLEVNRELGRGWSCIATCCVISLPAFTIEVDGDLL